MVIQLQRKWFWCGIALCALFAPLGRTQAGAAADSLFSPLRHVQHDLGKDAEAISSVQRALELTKSQAGSDHPSLIGPLDALAALYEKQGRYADALPLWMHALAIRVRQSHLLDPSVCAANHLRHAKWPQTSS
jgi:tetratricopeptide (TPR) repeat protein